RQPLVGLERHRGGDDNFARTLGDRRSIAGGRALRAGVERPLGAEGYGLGQADAGFRSVDRDRPAVAGHVPVKLVVAVEEAELAGGRVPNDVSVLAVREENVGITDAHAHAVADTLERVRLRLPVAFHALDVEADTDPPSVALVGRREVAKDPAADLIAFDRDADGFATSSVPSARTSMSLCHERMRSSASAVPGTS